MDAQFPQTVSYRDRQNFSIGLSFSDSRFSDSRFLDSRFPDSRFSDSRFSYSRFSWKSGLCAKNNPKIQQLLNSCESVVHAAKRNVNNSWNPDLDFKTSVPETVEVLQEGQICSKIMLERRCMVPDLGLENPRSAGEAENTRNISQINPSCRFYSTNLKLHLGVGT